jgi:hypothetical protein
MLPPPVQMTRDEWASTFEGVDACISAVLSLEERPARPHNFARAMLVEGMAQSQPRPVSLACRARRVGFAVLPMPTRDLCGLSHSPPISRPNLPIFGEFLVSCNLPNWSRNLISYCIYWRARQDSNLWPLPSEGNALSS